jgi:hypothetical protein
MATGKPPRAHWILTTGCRRDEDYLLLRVNFYPPKYIERLKMSWSISGPERNVSNLVHVSETEFTQC